MSRKCDPRPQRPTEETAKDRSEDNTESGEEGGVEQHGTIRVKWEGVPERSDRQKEPDKRVYEEDVLHVAKKRARQRQAGRGVLKTRMPAIL